jgi:hypothetical protein
MAVVSKAAKKTIDLEKKRTHVALGWSKLESGEYRVVEFLYDPENPENVALAEIHNTGLVKGKAFLKFEKIAIANKIIP